MNCKCGFKFSEPGEFRNCEAFITNEGEGGFICPKCSRAYVGKREVQLIKVKDVANDETGER